MKKKKSIAIAVVIIVTLLAAVYVCLTMYFQNHFSFGTSINGIDVGGCDVEKAEQLIGDEVSQYTLTLVERDGEETIDGSDISIKAVFDGEVAGLLEEQESYKWPYTLFGKAPLTLSETVEYDDASLKQVLNNLGAMGRQTAPVNAYCSDYSETAGYVVVPAVYGTSIDQLALQKNVKASIESLDETIDLDETGCYKDPSVLDDDEKLLALIDRMNSYTGMTITYTFGDKTEVLDGSTVSTWLSASDDNEMVIDEDAVLTYVKSLASEYNTAYKPKNFTTSYGTTITISNGFYGWKIDNDGEAAQILSDLEAGESVTRDPVYSQTANSHGDNDWGDSYVEINLTAQHLYMYKNGSLVIESDFVSGSVAGNHSTHTGAFALTYKTLNAVLRGPDYETPVTYWMPFNGDEGMHDATWRSKFGGTIYKTNGSHGCINLPKSAAKTIYENIEKGYPVFVYNLSGTESKSTSQSDIATVINYINAIGTVTLESESAITTARTLYDALPDSSKADVTNYDYLVAAEAQLEQLKAGASAVDEANQAALEQQAAEEAAAQAAAEQQAAEAAAAQAAAEQQAAEAAAAQAALEQQAAEEAAAQEAAAAGTGQ